jgi:isocitrate dehydrogenase kinase/phosphatase
LKRAETISSAAAALTDSRLAALCAEAVQQAFANYQGRFDEITRRARERFLARDLKESYADSAERLHLYSRVLDGLTNRVESLLGARLRERSIWQATKAVYSSLIAQSIRWEIGESFFNSLTRRVFATEGVDQAIEFVDTDFDAPPTSSPLDVRRIYSGEALPELISAALTDPEAGGFATECWNELGVSVRLAAERVEMEFPDAGQRVSKVRLEMINRAFYRGGGAYLVGRAIREGDDGVALPLAFCLRHENERGITLDAVLFGEADLSILFSYTRAYFRVNADCPHALVHSLRQLMPLKRLADL